MTWLLIYPFSGHRVRASSDNYDLILAVDRLEYDDIRVMIMRDVSESAFGGARLSLECNQLIITKVLVQLEEARTSLTRVQSLKRLSN